MLQQKTPLNTEQLDQLGAEIVEAFSADAEEIEQMAASPFMFRRIQARIAAEERRRAEPGSLWFALFKGLRLALPAFALVAAFTIGGALFATSEAENAPAAVAGSTTGNTLDTLFFDGGDELASAVLYTNNPVTNEVAR
jgi:anti-sigma-K factor RskA